MTTAKQLEANRQNAQKSTGPRTSEGKAASRMNALKHGLLSKEVLLPEGEQKEALEVFSGRLRADLVPVGELESLFVDRIIVAAWRLRRVLTAEGQIFQEVMEPDYMGEGKSIGGAFRFSANGGDTFLKLSRYEVAIERSMYRALHELQRLQAARGGEQVPPPAVLDMTVDSNGNPHDG